MNDQLDLVFTVTIIASGVGVALGLILYVMAKTGRKSAKLSGVLMGVSSVYQVLVTGSLVILAVTVDQMSRKGAR